MRRQSVIGREIKVYGAAARSSFSKRAVVAVATLLALSVVVCAAGNDQAPRAVADPSGGSVLSAETFTGANVSDPRWVGMGSACLTGATSAPPSGGSNLGVCPAPNNSPALGETPGYLQLANQNVAAMGGAIYNRAIPTAAGIDVVFDKWQYSNDVRPADGLSFFAVDGAYDLSTLGAGSVDYTGGSLGYTGIPHGYFGVGLDLYGNFVDTDRDPARGCGNPHSGIYSQSIGIRGSGDGVNGYCLISTSQVRKFGLKLSGSSVDDSHQLVHIVMTPVTATSPNPTLTVSVDFTGTGNNYKTILSSQLDAPPATLKFGFAGATTLRLSTELIRMRSLSTVLPIDSVSLNAQVDHSSEIGTPYTRFTTGDTVPITYTVTNTSGSTLSDVAVNDAAINTISCPSTTLNPGDSMQCAGTYGVTQADVDSGGVSSAATVTAANFEGTTVTASSSITIPTFALSLPLSVSASTDSVASAGNTVTWSFSATNPGGTPLSNLEVTLGSFSGTGAPPQVSCAASTIPPDGGSVLCTAQYTVTQADIDSVQSLDFTATAHASTSAGTPVSSGEESAPVTISQSASLGLSAATTPDTVNTAGQAVGFTFTVANTGNAAVSSISVAADDSTALGRALAISCPATSLLPGESETCTGSYQVTQADIDSGSMSLNVTATASIATGAKISSPSVPLNITAVQNLIEPDVVPVAISAPITASGQTVTYAFTVSNKSNVTLSSLTAQGTPLGAEVGSSDLTCTASVLAPGASTTCQRQYVVTQADMDQGADLSLTTTIQGKTPSALILPADNATLTAQINQTPSLVLSASSNPTAATQAGQSLAFSVAATNTGNVTLTNVFLAPVSYSGSAIPGPLVCQTINLAPGQTVTCTTNVAVAQEDIDAGADLNYVVNASAAAPSGAVVNATQVVATNPIDQQPALTVSVSASPDHLTRAGDPVEYVYTVSNSGNTTVSSVGFSTVSFTGAGNLASVTCPANTVAPGATITCMRTYIVTSKDLSSGANLVLSEKATALTQQNQMIYSGAVTTTVNSSASALGATGSTISWALIGLSLGGVALGIILIAVKRRKNTRTLLSSDRSTRKH